MKQILSLVFLFCALSVSAQLVATAPAADFGIISEDAGKAPLRIYVLNTDTVPQAILKVVPSCGCTAAEFQKEPFAPGDSAWIDLLYDPYLRPGQIDKLVRVYPVKGNVLRIPVKGVVKASEETIEQIFPTDGDLLRLTEKTFLTLRPLTEIQRSFYADAYNNNDFPVWVEIDNNNEALEWLVSPNPVPPYQKASIGLYLYPEKESHTDINEYKVNLHTALSPEDLKKSEPTELKIYHGTP